MHTTAYQDHIATLCARMDRALERSGHDHALIAAGVQKMRFLDDMPYPYAAIVWDMVLPLQTLDENAILAFYKAYGEQFNPEKQCAAPSASPPAATPTPATSSGSGAPSSGSTSAPTTTPAASATPAGS